MGTKPCGGKCVCAAAAASAVCVRCVFRRTMARNQTLEAGSAEGGIKCVRRQRCVWWYGSGCRAGHSQPAVHGVRRLHAQSESAQNLNWRVLNRCVATVPRVVWGVCKRVTKACKCVCVLKGVAVNVRGVWGGVCNGQWANLGVCGNCREWCVWEVTKLCGGVRVGT